MDKKQLINAVIILVILMIISFFTFKKNIASWHRGNDINKKKLVTNLDVNKVAKITITDNSATLTLHKNSDDKWCVANRNDYPANFEKLSDFLLALTDTNVIQTPRITKTQLPSLKLVMPQEGSDKKDTGTAVTMYDKSGKKLLSFLIGDRHYPKQEEDPTSFNRPEADGCYVLKEGTNQVALVDNSLSVANPDPKQWIDKNFFKIPDIVSVSRTDSKGNELWRISRGSLKAPWEIANRTLDEQPLPRPMMEATSAFSNMTFNDILPIKNEDFKDADTITVVTAEGFIYKIKVAPQGNNFIAKCTISINPSVLNQNSGKDNSKETSNHQESLTAKKRLLTKKLDTLKKYTNWAFELPKYKVEKVLKKRDQFCKIANL